MKKGISILSSANFRKLQISHVFFYLLTISVVFIGSVSNLACNPAFNSLKSSESIYEIDGFVTNDYYSQLAKQYYLEATNVTQAWETSRSDGAITVAVLDTGVNYKHEDLSGRILSEYGWDAVEDKSYLTSNFANSDPLGHGTMVAGIIAAQANNAIGIAGVSYNANILPIRVFKEDNTSTSYILLKALNKINDYLDSNAISNLKIINMSFGTYTYDYEVHKLINHLYKEHGILFVSAGGNGDNGSASTSRIYPGDLDECLSVSAVDQDGLLTSWSDFNSYKDLSAPGVEILSTSSDGGYAYGKGTSFAAPIVSGVAALIWSQYPSCTVTDLMDALKNGATSLNVDKSKYGTYGIVNALDSLRIVSAKYGEGQMFRLYNPNSGEHLYTSNPHEKVTLVQYGWIYEGIAWLAPSSGVSVHRLYNPNSGDHHYTTDSNEKDVLSLLGWKYEGVGWYSDENNGRAIQSKCLNRFS